MLTKADIVEDYVFSEKAINTDVSSNGFGRTSVTNTPTMC